MTTEAEDAIRTKTWPCWAVEQDAKRIKFKAIVATLSYAGVNERGPSYKFVEDTTMEQGRDGKTYPGRFWRLQGPYDTQTRTFAVAPDPGFNKGDRVRVVLEASMSGNNIYGNVTSIQAAPAPTESAASPARAPEGQRDETRASIERQTAYKGQTEVVCAILSTGKEVREWMPGNNDEVATWRTMRDALWYGHDHTTTLNGLADDLTFEDSPLVRQAQAMGGEITEVGDAES